MKLHEAFAGLLAGALVCACLDLSPVEYHRPDAGADSGMSSEADGGDDDGGAGDASIGSSPECRMCLESGPCSEPYATCHASSKCAIFAQCMSDTGCWPAKIVDLENVPACVSSCGAMAKFTSQVDPEAVLIVPVLICAQADGPCGSLCDPQ